MSRGNSHWSERFIDAWAEWSIGCALVPCVILVGFFLLFMLGGFIEGVLAPWIGSVASYVVAISVDLAVASTGVWLGVSSWQYRRQRRLERRRMKSGLCRKCGYDVRASEERCPECGALILRTIPADLA
jgi:hypothetical protein